MKKLNDIEKLMQQQASEKGTFAYNETHWKEMSAMLDANDVATENIEKAMKTQASVAGLAFQPEFWNEMEQMLDSNSTTAPQVDRSAAADSSKQTFLYKEKYWKEMSAILDRHDRKKKLALWTTVAAACLVGFGIVASLWNNSPEYNQLLVSGQDSDFEINILGGIAENEVAQQNSFITKAENSESRVSSEINQTFSEGQNGVLEITEVGNDTKDIEQQKRIEPDLNNGINVNQTKGTDLVELNLRKENIEGLDQIRYGSSLNQVDLTIKRPSTTRSSFYVHAGMLMANAPEGNVKDRTALGYGFKGGLGYSFMKKNWGFETGLNFIYRTGLNHELAYNRKLFGTKLWEETDLVRYKAMVSLELPVLAKAQFKNHVVGVGLSGVWNMSAHSSYSQFKSYSDEVSVVNNNFGTKDGLKPFDLRMQLQYEYQFKSGIAIGVNAHFGMINQIDSDIMMNSSGYRDVGGTLFLKYNFIRL